MSSFKGSKRRRSKYDFERTKGLSKYDREKTGWVTFKNTKKKQKLRAWLLVKARWLTRYGDNPFLFNKIFLIDYYNKDGLQGVNDAFTIAANAIIEKTNNEELGTEKFV